LKWKIQFFNRRTTQIVHTHTHTLRNIYLLQYWFLNDRSSHIASKSMAFVFGSVQKHFDSSHLFRHSTNSSWILQNVITCLSIQAVAKSISCDQSFLLRYTWVFSIVMRLYRPQYIDRVWCGSPSSCTSFFDILLLNVTRMKHCKSFNTTWPEEVPVFTYGN